MGSLVEVLPHFHSNMLGAESRQTPSHQHQSSPHRTSSTRQSPSEASSSSTIRPVSTARYSTTDTPMVDVMPSPPRPAPIPQRQSTHSLTRELAFHNVGPSQSSTSSGFKTSPSTQTSPVHATPLPPSVTLRPVGSDTSSSSPCRSPNSPSMPSPPRIKVQSLSHIQSFVIDDTNPLSPSRNNSRIGSLGGRDFSPQYEISEMPVAEIIEMVAGLLTKITTTNDRQHEYIHRHIPSTDSSSNLNPQTTSVLAFHGKNVPSISILSYLSRIHKYCPTTYEVFLSLLVYFDRMTERVNAGPIVSLRQANQQSLERHAAQSQGTSPTATSPTASQKFEVGTNQVHTPPHSGSSGKPTDMSQTSSQTSAKAGGSPPSPPIYPSLDQEPANLSQFFVVDSFNIHRLVIAGVTCASKFFSDIFYTNSRYAKVGGLPLNELNHLELQFLILNDFRLAIPLEEMEAYGTMLVEFYAREVLAQQHTAHAHTARSLAAMVE